MNIISGFLEPMAGNQGDVLYLENEPAEAMFIIQSGQVEFTITTPSGEEVIAVLGESESFGEASLLMRGNRILSARAANSVQLVELSMASFLELKRTYPDVCLRLIMAIVKRLSFMVGQSQTLFRDLLIQHLQCSKS